MGTPPSHASAGSKAPGRGANFQCLLSKSPISAEFIRTEAQAQRMGSMMLAIVADSPIGRVFLDPLDDHVRTARSASPNWKPDIPFFQEGLGFRVGNYGFTKWTDFFTSRNLVALETFSDLVTEARDRAFQDAIAAGFPDDGKALVDGGAGARAYAEAVSVFLAFGVSRAADYWSSNAIWEADGGFIEHVWRASAADDLGLPRESNPFSGSSGNWANNFVSNGSTALLSAFQPLARGMPSRPMRSRRQYRGTRWCRLTHPTTTTSATQTCLTSSTSGCEALCEAIYPWPVCHGGSAQSRGTGCHALPTRRASRKLPKRSFFDGMTQAMQESWLSRAHPAFPVTIYYAFKQSERKAKPAPPAPAGRPFWMPY